MPDDEDLEKMKITLNWIVKNRNKVRTFYLNDYRNKQDLYSHLSSFSAFSNPPEASTFDIKNFLNSEMKEALAQDLESPTDFIKLQDKILH